MSKVPPATSIWRRFQFWASEGDPPGAYLERSLQFVPEVWARLPRFNLRCWYCRFPVPAGAIQCPTCGGPGDHPAARPRLIVPQP